VACARGGGGCHSEQERWAVGAAGGAPGKTSP
jgi:hypothetical protein